MPTRAPHPPHAASAQCASLIAPYRWLAADAKAVLAELGLAEHLIPQRSNGFFSMVERIRADARAAVDDRRAQ